MTDTVLLVVSSGFAIAGSVIYLASILRGRTRPHRVTRLVLLFVLALNFVSMLAADSNPGAVLYAGLCCAFAVSCFFLSLGRGMGGTSNFDWLCFAIAVAGIIAWQITENPLLSVWFASLADLVAYLPAFVKTWHHPHTESPWLYILSFFAAALSLAAYPLGPESIFQGVIVFSVWIMLYCIYHKQLAAKFSFLKI